LRILEEEKETMKFLNGMAAALTAISLGLVASAQTTPSPTCTTAPSTITAFSIESTLTLNNLLTTLTPTLPASTLAAISSGALEIRERLIYNPQANTLTSTTFTVAAGSPTPTPIATNLQNSVLQTYSISIDKVYTSCQPRPSVLIVGTITANSGGVGITGGPFGSFQGAPAAVSIGYTTDTPPKINNVVVLVAGAIVGFAPSGVGTVTFPATPVTPPGSTATPSAVITLPGGTKITGTGNTSPIQVLFSPFHLDGSASSDPGGSVLTYLWTSDLPANFVPGPNVPNPDVFFSSGRNTYHITLTVKNSAGVSGQTTASLQFVGR
jgi:hypothetical protein